VSGSDERGRHRAPPGGERAVAERAVRDGQTVEERAGRERGARVECHVDRRDVDEETGDGLSHRRRRQQHGLLESFNWAFEGIVWVLRHQRNMRIHFAVAIAVVVAALFFALTKLELIALFVAISFVLIAEMLNTAIEHAIDTFSTEFHPSAKVAKDVAAGAVLIATMNALVVAYLIFYDHVASTPYTLLQRVRSTPVSLTVIALVLVILVVIVVKALVGRGTLLHGGLPSGHAAVAFGGWVAVTFIASSTQFAVPVSMITLAMAVLTGQSRVQAGIHSQLEVLLGAVLGIAVTTLLFRLWYL
jgi:diacylglycerol kinase (ATP)